MQRERVAGLFAAAVVLAGCSSAGSTGTEQAVSESSSSSLASSPVAADSSSAATSPVGADLSPSATASPGHGSGPRPDGADAVPVVVAVSGGPLPQVLIDAYRTGGGVMAEPADWFGRYGNPGLPVLAGAGTVVVEGTVSAELSGGVLRRTDEINYLVMDDRGSVVEILDDVAAALEVGPVVTDETSNDQGAVCVERRHVSTATWTLQGCDYPSYPALRVVGASRVLDTTGGLPIVATSQSAVAAVAGVELRSVDVELTDPGPDDATLSTIISGVHDLAVEDLKAQLLAGPLAGWNIFDGEVSVVLVGPDGSAWTISPGLIGFELRGQF